MSGVTVHDVSLRFDETIVLDRVNLAVGSGERVALLGPSGSGKSTLLKVIAGLLRPDAGRVEIGGRDVTQVPTHRRGVGFVFQDEQLFPHRSVADNIGFGLKMAGVAKSERRRRSDEWLVRVGLTGFGDRAVTDLSGGEAKRIALARTLIVQPAVVLLDEPLTGLDRDLHDQLRVEVADLLESTGTSSITVTHDHDDAAALGTRTVQLSDLMG
ncbi:MAG: ABC transporter ATP-binding protein [Actinomycetota bacterium]